MFAHQVIEDLTRGDFPHPGLETLRKNGIAGIRKAIHFHIDDVIGTMKLCKASGTEGIFENTQYIRLPYKTIWVDYKTGVSNAVITKQGILIDYVEDFKYTIETFSYVKTLSAWAISPLLSLLSINGNGVNRGKIQYRSLIALSEKASKDYQEDTAITLSALNCFLLVLNCKNITTEKIPAPDPLNKKRRKAGKQELFDYHVLNVVVPSKKRDYREASTPLSHNRVHLCRGHFKEYTAEHPLFGHYTGLYWWQPHVRGQNKDGIVMKGYNVKHTE
ncbi:MAG: hypothetical protein WC331_11105 [Candidatus Omnitrophota bacterium]|jgi:hypothetical protein